MSSNSQFRSHDGKQAVIVEVCRAITDDNLERARQILNEKYPFAPTPPGYCKRAKPVREVTFDPDNQREPISKKLELATYKRDGFIDRYTGCRLVYHRVLELITQFLPKEFPVEGSWKLAGTHIAYYDLWPSVDHIKPVRQGGHTELENLATTSWCNNLVKSAHTLEDIGERIFPPGALDDWDGLYGWYQQYLADHPHFSPKT